MTSATMFRLWIMFQRRVPSAQALPPPAMRVATFGIGLYHGLYSGAHVLVGRLAKRTTVTHELVHYWWDRTGRWLPEAREWVQQYGGGGHFSEPLANVMAPIVTGGRINMADPAQAALLPLLNLPAAAAPPRR